MRPVRAAGLQIDQVTDGYVVIQPDRSRLHYLNHTAVLVLEACDGRIAADELPALVGRLCGLPEPPTRDVELCLQQLLTEGLLVARTSAAHKAPRR